MDAVWAIIEDHRAALERVRRAGGASAASSSRRGSGACSTTASKRHFLGREDVQRLLPEMEAAVASGKLTPTEAARRLLAVLDERTEGPALPSRRKRSA